jgi:NADH-quinone oxidoreductase subunit L
LDAGALAMVAVFLPLAAAPVVAAAGRLGAPAARSAAVAAAAATAAATLALLTVIGPDPVRAAPWAPSLGLAFDVRVDALGASVAAVAGLIGAAVVVYATAYLRRGEDGAYSEARFFALVLVFIGAMVGLALSDTLLAFFVFFEVVGLCSYLLIAFRHGDPRARRAGLQALVVTQAGGAALLIAVVALWAQAGATRFSELGSIPAASGALQLAAWGALIAAMAKSAQVPLHGWLPDAMEAPTPVSALIHAATMVNAGVYLVARTAPAFAAVPGWAEAVLGVGLASALLGALGALAERDLKRVLAYSTVSQLGVMFAAVGAGAVAAGAGHLVAQAVVKALLFLAAGLAVQAAGTRDLAAMGGLGRTMRWTSAAFLVGALSMAGVPPLAGFWSKEAVMAEALARQPLAFAALALIGLLTAAYAVRAWRLAFAGERSAAARPRGGEGAPEPPAMLGPVLALAAAAAAGLLFLRPLEGALGGASPGAAAWEALPLAAAAGATAVAGAMLFAFKAPGFAASGAGLSLSRAAASGFGTAAFARAVEETVAGASMAAQRLEARALMGGARAFAVTVALALATAVGVAR